MLDAPIDTLFSLDGMYEEDADEEHLRAVRRALDELSESLNDPEKPGSRYSTGVLSEYHQPLRLPDDLVAGLENAARALWNAKFESKGHVERGLMRHIAFSARPRSIPFFREAIDFSRPRDSLIPARQRWAVAGIAFTEAKTGSKEARATLDDLLGHGDARVRASSVDALPLVRRNSKGVLEKEAASLLGGIAEHERTLEPRWLARLALAEQGLLAAGDPQLYVFKLARLNKTIEMQSAGRLGDLVSEVVREAGVDDDHLWEFRFGKDHPRLRWPHDMETPWDAPRLTVGEAGFLPRHRFDLIYDFGHNHRFTLQVVDVRATQKRGADREATP